MRVHLIWKFRSAELHELAYPLAPVPRIAVLGAGFRQNGKIRAFPESSIRELTRFEPEALAGPLPEVRRLAVHHPLHSVNRAVVVFTTVDEEPLSDQDRDLLWHAWQVPIFEQLRDLGSALLAAECEAHDGLHVVAQTSSFSLCNRPSHTLSTTPCPCGNPAPRLLPVRDMIVSAPLKPEWRNWQTRRI